MPLQKFFHFNVVDQHTKTLLENFFVLLYYIVVIGQRCPNFFDHFAVNSSKRTWVNGLELLSLNARGVKRSLNSKISKEMPKLVLNKGAKVSDT